MKCLRQERRELASSKEMNALVKESRASSRRWSSFATFGAMVPDARAHAGTPGTAGPAAAAAKACGTCMYKQKAQGGSIKKRKKRGA